MIGPATSAEHPGLRELSDSYVDLGDTLGRANVGLKAMTLLESVGAIRSVTRPPYCLARRAPGAMVLNETWSGATASAPVREAVSFPFTVALAQ